MDAKKKPEQSEQRFPRLTEEQKEQVFRNVRRHQALEYELRKRREAIKNFNENTPTASRTVN